MEFTINLSNIHSNEIILKTLSYLDYLLPYQSPKTQPNKLNNVRRLNKTQLFYLQYFQYKMPQKYRHNGFLSLNYRTDPISQLLASSFRGLVFKQNKIYKTILQSNMR